MIGNDGKPVARAAVLAAISVYNSEARGSVAFAAIPRSLVTILDHLAVGKTTYVKGQDGQLQITRGKDRKVVGR